jgi:hypothetical protein
LVGGRSWPILSRLAFIVVSLPILSTSVTMAMFASQTMNWLLPMPWIATMIPTTT